MIAWLVSGWIAAQGGVERPEAWTRRGEPPERASRAVNLPRAAVLKSLVLASRGLLFMSETDAPFTPVDAPQSPFAGLDDAAVRSLAGHPATDAVEVISVDAFFRNAVKEQEWHTPEELANAKRYQALVALIHAELPDAKVYRVGKIALDVLILGTGPGGGALGLTTKVVET